jgi:hypothetical protein
MTGDDFPLTTDKEVCTIHQNTFRAIWLVNAFLFLTLVAHATSKLPLDVGELRRLVRKGAPRTLPLWVLVDGLVGTALFSYKAATLWFFTDHTKVFAVLANAMVFGIFFGPVTWSFLFALVAPFLATAPDSAALIARVKKSFLLLGLLCSALIMGAVVMVQALRVEGEERVVLSIVFLSSLAFDIVLAMLACGIVCRKVCTFSFLCVPFHTDITDRYGTLLMLFKVLQVLDETTTSVSSLEQQGSERKESTDLGKLRRKFLVLILTIESLAGGVVLGIVGVFLIDFLRRRTWLFVATAVCVGATVEHIVLLLTPSMAKTKSSSIAVPLSSTSSKYTLSSQANRFFSKMKISPGTNAANMLAHPVAVLVRSQLAEVTKRQNRDEFVPPTEQPCAEHLKVAATLLQNNMFVQGENAMDDDVASLIEQDFVPTAQVHFEACIHQARSMVSEMRLRYHSVRKGHLALYTDTLKQIRQENTFPELQKRSDKLTERCKSLGRPCLQKAASVCDLYRGAEAVKGRYGRLMAMVASKTNTHFHVAPMKGLLRICEKLAMAEEWNVGAVLDVVRGAIECPSFSMMMNVLRCVAEPSPLSLPFCLPCPSLCLCLCHRLFHISLTLTLTIILSISLSLSIC